MGRRIRELRKRRRLLQREAAELVGVTENAYRAWEVGRNVPSPRNLERLAEVLQADPERIQFGDDEPDPEQIATVLRRLERIEALLRTTKAPDG